jgi:hypothetical protein
MSELPSVLYRYRPMSKTLPVEIEYNTAYFCPLDNGLNDKWEGVFEYEKSAPEDLCKVLIERARQDKKFEYVAILESLSESEIREIEAQAKAIGAIEMAGNKDWVGRPEDAARKNWGLVCFTERLNNRRMWEEYAKSGNGVVLEFDLSRVSIPRGALWKVRYSEQRGSTSVVRALTSHAEGEFVEALTYKKPQWEYEEEWRLLANRRGLFQITIPITRVILGYAMEPADKNEILNAMMRNGRPRLAQLIPTERPGKFVLHDRIFGDEEIEFV